MEKTSIPRIFYPICGIHLSALSSMCTQKKSTNCVQLFTYLTAVDIYIQL